MILTLVWLSRVQRPLVASQCFIFCESAKSIRNFLLSFLPSANTKRQNSALVVAMPFAGIDAENAANHPDIEKQWAVRAFEHAETFLNLIKKIDGKNLRLTKIDDDLYKDFREKFPNVNVRDIDELSDFKSARAKENWREFIQRYESKVEDYNFGTIVRLHALDDLDEANSMFVTRVQFLAVEIARNKEGLNSQFYAKINAS